MEPDHFRQTLGHYPTGVVVVTGITEDGQPVGMVVGSFTSVSLNPPQVAFMPRSESRTFARLRTAQSFCVNVLAADQEPICRRFATQMENKFDGIGWHPSPSGAPILDDVVAWIDCSFESIIEAGDHYIVIGRVLQMDVLRPAPPLLFFQGGYGRFTLPSLVANAQPDLMQGVRLAEFARDEMTAIAAELQAECSVLTTAGEDAVFVAMASCSREPSRIFLGSRVPLVPPVGAVFISHLGSVAVNEWLSRLPDADEHSRSAYIAQLERVRERGFSVSLRGRHSELDVHEAIRDYSSPDRLPQHERRFKAIIRETAELYEVDIDPGGRYDLHSIVVPVVGPLGIVQIALRAAHMPPGLSGGHVQASVDRLKQAAAAVAERIAEQTPLDPLPT